MIYPVDLLANSSNRLDPRGVFAPSLQAIKARLESRFYTTVATFSADLAHIFTNEIGVQPAEDTAELQMQMGGRAPELSLDQREKRKLAKRIIKSIQPSLEDAIRKESELSGRPFEKELKELDAIFESGVLSRRVSVIEATDIEFHSADHASANGAMEAEGDGQLSATKAHSPEDSLVAKKDDDVPMPDVDTQQGTPLTNEETEKKHTEPNGIITAAPSHEASSNGDGLADASKTATETTENGLVKKENGTGNRVVGPNNPLTPPLSSQGDQQQGPLAQGGIQWYMQPFDPIGTTIHEERWTGRDVMRGMSEELSELDEDELEGLVDHEEKTGLGLSNGVSGMANGTVSEPVKVHRTRRRWREV